MEAVEMAEGITALVTLPEDLDSTSTTNMVALYPTST